MDPRNLREALELLKGLHEKIDEIVERQTHLEQQVDDLWEKNLYERRCPPRVPPFPSVLRAWGYDAPGTQRKPRRPVVRTKKPVFRPPKPPRVSIKDILEQA